ncbi:unnamed protein product [Bursaphelenchus xylophilus]|uniref:(pine wood nematode) hypothetical protein n=1 Tax=Bursaphelenchus xylophilus TaxID=6326 RepID=A0A1I7SDF2_BURXY|nr:unnamed protein product [Bursaphelenchus xylophilus]CAG9130651.1 unnamed protein product [Bursaphelenchus xylophilus]
MDSVYISNEFNEPTVEEKSEASIYYAAGPVRSYLSSTAPATEEESVYHEYENTDSPAYEAIQSVYLMDQHNLPLAYRLSYALTVIPEPTRQMAVELVQGMEKQSCLDPDQSDTSLYVSVISAGVSFGNQGYGSYEPLVNRSGPSGEFEEPESLPAKYNASEADSNNSQYHF